MTLFKKERRLTMSGTTIVIYESISDVQFCGDKQH